MSTSSTYFAKSGVSLKSVKDYLTKTYGQIKDYITEQDFWEEFPTISGRLTNSKHGVSLFVYIPGSTRTPENENVPMDTVAGESISISASYDEKDIEILMGIAKKFGGYLNKSNALDEDDPDYWQYIEATDSTTNTEGGTDSLEENVFELLRAYNKKMGLPMRSENSPKMNYIVDFLKENLDEIKKL